MPVVGALGVLGCLLVLLGPISWLVAGDGVRRLQGREQTDALNAVRQTVLAATGGASVLIGLGYTARTYQLSRRGQVSDRFSTAIGQLASDKREERLGAVYALEHVMAESPQDHATVVGVLAAFVRENVARDDAPQSAGAEQQLAEAPRGVEPPADIRAAIEVLARRPEREEARRIDLRRTRLTGLMVRGFEFDAPPRLTRIFFTWADLRRADLRGADLREAILNGASLRQAFLAQAHLDRAGLVEADLRGAHLAGTRLTGADLCGADLRETRSLTAAQLSAAVLDATTKLPAPLEGDPWVGARIAACQAWRDEHGLVHPDGAAPPATASPE